MSDPLLRHWTLLRRIPRYPKKIDAATLANFLAISGYTVSRRSIERDLIKLCDVFPLDCDDGHKPYGWSWRASAPAFDLPGLDVHAALAFRLAGEHLRNLLPDATRAYLKPHFDQARDVLDKLPKLGLSTWIDKVRVVPSGLPMLPPAIDAEVLERTQTALLTDRRLQMGYRRRGEREVRDYVVNPLGLVYRDAVVWLVASVKDYDDPLQFAVHRMVAAEVLDVPRRVPPGFSLDAYLASHAFEFLLQDGPLLLEAVFDRYAVVRIQETPMAADQVLTELPGGLWKLTATTADTHQLRSWLRSLGAAVEVLAPASLRAEMAETAAALTRRYAVAPVPAVEASEPVA